jgi:hypothetical protein
MPGGTFGEEEARLRRALGIKALSSSFRPSRYSTAKAETPGRISVANVAGIRTLPPQDPKRLGEPRMRSWPSSSTKNPSVYTTTSPDRLAVGFGCLSGFGRRKGALGALALSALGRPRRGHPAGA